MIDIDDLESKAKAAIKSLVPFSGFTDEMEEFQDEASPETVLKLLAVVRAAMEYCGTSEGCQGCVDDIIESLKAMEQVDD